LDIHYIGNRSINAGTALERIVNGKLDTAPRIAWLGSAHTGTLVVSLRTVVEDSHMQTGCKEHMQLTLEEPRLVITLGIYSQLEQIGQVTPGCCLVSLRIVGYWLDLTFVGVVLKLLSYKI
jgi:hypothetical protein